MSRTILVADDNPLILKVLGRIFEATEDYELCAQATNGHDAIELALKHRPDLIILDMSMPFLNGLDAARRLKNVMPNVPIILFTQHADLNHAISAADLPVDRIVSKGDAAQLMRHVRSLAPPLEAASSASM
jgi:DNA-binding NarL/FixJ family response regulator